ncbi:MAG: AraC family transcriptional regulator [Pseudomonadota bacterium]
MDAHLLTETLIRGASAGLLLLLAAVLLRHVRCCVASRAGAVFALGTAAYAIQSSETLCAHIGAWDYLLTFLSMQCVTFFWWFANAALDDDFEWQSWHWTPFAVLSVLIALYLFVPPLSSAAGIVAKLIMLGLALHVLWMALAEHRNDLLEQRRRVRLLFVAGIGIACLGATLLEMFVGTDQLPQWASMLMAVETLVLSLIFAMFLLQPSAPLMRANNGNAPPQPSGASPADTYELQQLESLMRTGFYTRESLTISDFATELDIPEHRLRILINQQLGFRNFTAYLNSYRLSDARNALADPAQARRQITQIAFDLGYGSITPFNRAFKAEQGMTPTEYRRMALAEQQVTH